MNMLKTIKSWKLKYTIGSCDFALEIEDVTLIQLRRAVFINSKEEIATNYIKAVRILLEIGLCYKIEDYEALKKEALRLMEEWRNKFGSIEALHIVLIRYMENNHFFIGSQEAADIVMMYKRKADDLALKMMIENSEKLREIGVSLIYEEERRKAEEK